MRTTPAAATTQVTVRYFAAARAAAGTDSEPVDVAPDATVADLLAAVRERHTGEFPRVLERCSLLLDEVAVRDRDATVPRGATLDILPPFAGG